MSQHLNTLYSPKEWLEYLKSLRSIFSSPFLFFFMYAIQRII